MMFFFFLPLAVTGAYFIVGAAAQAVWSIWEEATSAI